MTTRKKRAQEARELAGITPVNAFASLKGNLYRTHAQHASKTCGLEFSDDGYVVQNAVHVLRNLLTFNQARHSSNHDYREGLDTRVQKFEQMGGSLPSIFNLKDETYSKCSPEELKERIIAVTMVDRSCDERFADFKKDRNEDAHLGRDDFPAARTRAAVTLDNHCNVIPKSKPSSGSSFAQYVVKDGSVPVKGKDGGIYPHIRCHNCNKYGDYQGACPKKRREKRKKDEDYDDENEKDESNDEQGVSAFGWVENSEEIDPNRNTGARTAI